MPDIIHTAVLSLGSNIEPVANLKKAVQLLQSCGQITAVSGVWESEAVGSNGPNFLNAAVVFKCEYTRFTLKGLVLRPIEERLGRVRSADKNAPRPMDLDITMFDGEVVDQELWARLFVARPLSELLPNLVNPENQHTLLQTADELHCGGGAIAHPEIILL